MDGLLKIRSVPQPCGNKVCGNLLEILISYLECLICMQIVQLPDFKKADNKNGFIHRMQH